MQLFAKGSKLAVRFSSTRGSLTVEDLWTMPLDGSEFCLDDVAQRVHAALEASESKSFVNKKPIADTALQIKMDIVTYIIAYKQNVAEIADKAAVTRTRNERIRTIIAKKKDTELEETSIEDLESMLET